MHRSSWVFVIESRSPGATAVIEHPAAAASAAALSDVGSPRGQSQAGRDKDATAHRNMLVDGSGSSRLKGMISGSHSRTKTTTTYLVPEAARSRVWLGFDSPHATVMSPLYASQEVPPPSWTWALQCKMSRISAFWCGGGGTREMHCIDSPIMHP